jgi:hypothetical protein
LPETVCSQLVKDIYLRATRADDTDDILIAVLHDWYEHAMPTLQVDAQLAASQMCTRVGQLLTDFRMPFPVVMLELPEDVVVVPGGKQLFSMRHVCLGKEKDTWMFFAWDSEMIVRLHAGADAITNFWDNPEKTVIVNSNRDVGDSKIIEDTGGRAIQMLAHLIVNACLMMTSSDAGSCVESRVSHPYSRRRHGPPERRYYRFTRPVAHDVRKAVRDYALHGGKSPPCSASSPATGRCSAAGQVAQSASGSSSSRTGAAPKTRPSRSARMC